MRYIHCGVIYNSPYKYLRVDIGSSFNLVQNDSLDLMYISIPEDSLSDDVVSQYPQFELAIPNRIQGPLKPTNTETKWYSLDGLRIRPLVHKYRITQILTFNVTLFSHYDERSLTIVVNNTTPKDQYLDHLRSIPYIEVEDSTFEYHNYNNVMLDKEVEIHSVSDMPITPKSYFTRYIFNEPHMVYQLNKRILKELQQYNIDNIEKSGDPDQDLMKSANVLTYRIGNESMEKMHVFPSGYMRRAMAVSVPLEYQIKVQSLSIAMDIRNKFMNYDLISNVTSIEMVDANGNPFRVNLWWDPQMSDLGDKESTIDENGNYTHLLTIRCTVNYYILRDEEELVRIHRVKGVFNLIEKLSKTGFQVKYLKDTKTGEKILEPLRPLAEWEIKKILKEE